MTPSPFASGVRRHRSATGPEPDAEPDPNPDPEPAGTRTRTRPAPDRDPDPDPDPDPNPNPDPDPDRDPEPDPDPEPPEPAGATGACGRSTSRVGIRGSRWIMLISRVASEADGDRRARRSPPVSVRTDRPVRPRRRPDRARGSAAPGGRRAGATRAPAAATANQTAPARAALSRSASSRAATPSPDTTMSGSEAVDPAPVRAEDHERRRAGRWRTERVPLRDSTSAQTTVEHEHGHDRERTRPRHGAKIPAEIDAEPTATPSREGRGRGHEDHEVARSGCRAPANATAKAAKASRLAERRGVDLRSPRGGGTAPAGGGTVGGRGPAGWSCQVALRGTRTPVSPVQRSSSTACRSWRRASCWRAWPGWSMRLVGMHRRRRRRRNAAPGHGPAPAAVAAAHRRGRSTVTRCTSQPRVERTARRATAARAAAYSLGQTRHRQVQRRCGWPPARARRAR